MKYTLLCFSGTGNSLYIAQKLMEQLENSTLYSINSPSIPNELGGENHVVGFIFPSYYGNLPRIVEKQVNQIKILPNTWIFGIVTMGAVGEGSIAALQKALKSKGNQLSYGRGIRMPANYVMSYNPTEIKKGESLNKKADEIIKKISTDIQNQKNRIRSNFITSNNLYKNISSLDEKFTVDSTCIHCGICHKICPVGNIDFSNQVPHWMGHCEHCAACINWCPKKSIQYGEKTIHRRRYSNPAISLEDFIAFESK